MANESLRFDIIGNDRATGAFSRVGGSVKDMGDRMNIATKQALVLDEAMNRQRTAARSSVDATLALAKADDILADAEHTLRDGALEAEFALKKEAEAKKKSGDAALEAAAKNKRFQDSLNKTGSKIQDKGGPSWLGPALLAAPVATSVAGVGAGAAIGLGGAFVTAGIALAGYGAVAKSVLSQASTATQAVQKAQDAYNVAIASGTSKAKAYKTEQLAISKAYADMSPAQIQLSKQLGGISDQWSRFKQSVTPLIASSLQPWLAGVGTGLTSLKSLITPMGPVIHGLGSDFATLTDSSVFRTFAAWVGTTGAKVTGSAGNAVLDLITGMTFLLPKFSPLITGAANGISKWGDAFVKWSASQKAANEIQSFLDWFHKNGPLVTGLLKNVGGALKALSPGLGSASVTELNLISGFFAFVAKLPPGVAKPLEETAAVLLTLNKLGVVKVGLNVSGKLAGKFAQTLLGKALLEGAGSLALPVTLTVAAIAGLSQIKDKKGGGSLLAPKAADLGFGGSWAHDIAHWWDVLNGEVGGIQGKMRHATYAWADSVKAGVINDLDGMRHEASHIWDATWNNTVGRLNRGSADTLKILGGWQHNVSHWFDVTRHDAASIWDSAWNNTVGRTRRGVSDVTSWAGRLPGNITRIFSGAGWWLFHAGQDVLQGFWNGLAFVWHKVTGWISSLAGWIKAHKGPVSFDRSLLEPAGRAIMTGLRVGLEGGWIGIKDIVSGMAGNIGNQFSGLLSLGGKLGGKLGGFLASLFGGGGSGALGGDAAANKALARKMFPWPASMFPAYDYLEMREAGYNRFARNPSSGAYGIAQALPPTKMPFAAQAAGGSHAGSQLGWQFGYIRSVYGNPVNAAAHERAFNWYAGGTMNAAPGWAVVGERGPELMHFRGGEQVYPSGTGPAGGTTTIIVKVDPAVAAVTPDRQLGRHIAGHVTQFIKSGGRLYPPGVAPR